MAAICLLFSLAAVLGVIAAIVAATSRRPDAGEAVREFSFGAFVVALLLWFLG